MNELSMYRGIPNLSGAGWLLLLDLLRWTYEGGYAVVPDVKVHVRSSICVGAGW